MTRRTTALPRALAALALCLAVAGCGGQGDDEDAATDPAGTPEASETTSETTGETTSPSPDQTKESPMPSQSPGGAGGAAQEAAVADLAQRLGVDAAEITVSSTEAVTWRDGSLGCSEPGMMYTQALVEGTRVVLEAEGQRYEYHAGGNRTAFLCEKPTQ